MKFKAFKTQKNSTSMRHGSGFTSASKTLLYDSERCKMTVFYGQGDNAFGFKEYVINSVQEFYDRLPSGYEVTIYEN